jgi:hypothetical protein
MEQYMKLIRRTTTYGAIAAKSGVIAMGPWLVICGARITVNKLNKVWTSLEAVRMNTKTSKGLTSPWESKVNTDDSTEITAVIKGDTDMAIKVDECAPVDNPKNEPDALVFTDA